MRRKAAPAGSAWSSSVLRDAAARPHVGRADAADARGRRGFWERLIERRLVRWVTRLHDDFMLPHYVEQDFRDVLEELAGLGFRLDPAWFIPHMEFRFPRLGEVTLRGAELELRHALEPWHVLGEEPAAGGTIRFVDSSAERLQARVSGWTEERYVLACNGARFRSPARDGGRVRGRRALQGLGAAQEPASDRSGPNRPRLRHV